MIRTLCLLLPCVMAGPLSAAEATIAVAANFLSTAEELETAFEDATDHELTLVHGSTGLLYAQIRQGAPFDVFLAADQERPALLLDGGQAISIKPYALGQLALIGKPGFDRPDAALPQIVTGTRIAIANPDVAPYGQAAEAILATGAGPDVDVVLGENVGQVASLFATGNVPLAIVSTAQLPDLAETALDARMLDHPPVPQDAALLERGAANAAAKAFYDFLGSDTATALMRARGYGIPS